MCNLWQESKLRRKLTFWITRQPASAQRYFERGKMKYVETVDFRPVKIKGHIRRPLLKDNLMHRTAFSIQTESRQERSQSWKRFADKERVFRLTLADRKLLPQNDFLFGGVMKTRKKRTDFWIVFITETVAFRKKRTVSTNGYYGKIAEITS